MIELSAIDRAIVAAHPAVVIGRGPWAGLALFVLEEVTGAWQAADLDTIVV